jgi:Ni/Co efflux regulator RcnB
MTKLLLALGTAAVAMTATAPASARTTCARWRHGHCVTYVRTARPRAHRYRVGYVFGPNYSYTSYRALPRRYVTRYRLAPRYRYVYNGGYIYVVDPRTYAIVRILNAL